MPYIHSNSAILMLVEARAEQKATPIGLARRIQLAAHAQSA